MDISKEQVISTLIVIVITLVVTYLILRALKRLMVAQENKFGPKIHIKFFYNIIRVFVILVAFATIGSQFSGFQKTVSTLLASSGILALGVSLAAQESMSNFIDGLFLSMFQPFNIGDRITLPEKDNLTGIVTEMNLRHTVITTYNNTSFIIPNKVINGAIIDNSNFNVDRFAYPIDVSVAYDTDLELACQVMADTITSLPEFVDPRTPEQIAAGAPKVTVLVREFGDSGISLRCPMYSHNVNESFKACSDARIALKKAFDANGITIPFTTITISK